MAADPIVKIARMLFAMAMKKKGNESIAEIVRGMKDAKYQRTFTDEMFPHKPRPRESVSEEQRRHWEEIAKLKKW